jgi:hypothetical protein
VLSTRPSVLLILALLVTLLCTVPTAIADEPLPALKMEAISAFDGYVKHGEWLPVWLYLENNGSGLRAEARVRAAHGHGVATFTVPVSLPPGSQKRVPVYVLSDSFTRALEVQLVDPKGSCCSPRRWRPSH